MQSSPIACLVELTATVAAYNMVSRFLEALQISTARTLDPPSRGEVWTRAYRFDLAACCPRCVPAMRPNTAPVMSPVPPG